MTQSVIKKMGGLKKIGVLCALLLGSTTIYAADVNKGANMYRTHCAACHGDNGYATMPGAPNFVSYDKSMMRPDYFIMQRVKEGKNAMPGFQGVLQDKDILDVIAFMRTFD